jgi:hypothetical protein
MIQEEKARKRIIASTPISYYEVMYAANAFPPLIWLVDSAGTFIGQLNFHPNGTALPPDGMNGAVVILHYHLDDFENCAALLRNEKTVYPLYNGPGVQNGVLTAETIPST